MYGLKAHSLCDAVSKYSTVIWLVGLAWVKTNKQTKKIIQNLYVTSSSQFFHHSMVLCLWKCGPVIISVTHHHPQLHRFGNLPAVGTLNHNADMKLSKQKRWKKKKKQRGKYLVTCGTLNTVGYESRNPRSHQLSSSRPKKRDYMPSRLLTTVKSSSVQSMIGYISAIRVNIYFLILVILTDFVEILVS